jgi:hypothetical protein
LKDLAERGGKSISQTLDDLITAATHALPSEAGKQGI